MATPKTSTKKPSTKKATNKPTVIAQMVKIANETATTKIVGLTDASAANEVLREFNKMVNAFAASKGLQATRKGSPIFNKVRGRLTIPPTIFVEIPPKIVKGSRVEHEDGEGEVTKIAGQDAFVLFDGKKTPVRTKVRKLNLLTETPSAKSEDKGATLAQGVRVAIGAEYRVKKGGKVTLVKEKDGRNTIWVIRRAKEGGSTFAMFGSYGSARKDADGEKNRRFAELQLRRLAASVSGAKKSLPEGY